MGKRCDCAAVLDAFERDPRLMALPLAARALWLMLVRRMQQLGASALVLGSDVPNPAEIAMMVAVSETELETHLAPLLARGLLVRREDGALACALLEAREKRAQTARINGMKGGRPRNDGTPPRQRSMMLAVPGGQSGGAAEPDAKPSAAGVGSAAKLSSSFSEKELSKAELRARGEEAHRIGMLAADAAGLDQVRGTWTTGVVADWLARGADEALILDVVREVMARPNAPTPRGLGYFSPAVGARLAERPATPAAAPVDPCLEPADAYNARVEAWQRQGCFGPMPQRRRTEVAA